MPAVSRRTLLMTLSAAALPAPVFAADPWDAKDPAQWNEKDLQKLMTDSPWARQVSVPLGGPSVGSIGGGGRGRGGRGGGGGGGSTDASSSAGMGGSPMGGEGGGGMGGADRPAPTATFLIRWQSAKPIKIANVRSRMGAEADTSTQAREFIEKQEREYVIAVIMPPMRTPGEGRPGGEGGGERKGPGPEAEEKMKESTTLSWKGHDQIHPASVIMPKPGQSAVVFHFDKTHPIELDDKEVEFAMKRGNMEIKKKFKLKEMVYKGELAL